MAKFNQWRYLDAYANAADLADRRNYPGYTFGRTDTSTVDENDIIGQGGGKTTKIPWGVPGLADQPYFGFYGTDVRWDSEWSQGYSPMGRRVMGSKDKGKTFSRYGGGTPREAASSYMVQQVPTGGYPGPSWSMHQNPPGGNDPSEIEGPMQRIQRVQQLPEWSEESLKSGGEGVSDLVLNYASEMRKLLAGEFGAANLSPYEDSPHFAPYRESPKKQEEEA